MPQLIKAWSAVGLDGSLLILCFISGVLAMYRGMTREVLTLANWVIAGGAAYLMFLQRAWAEDLGQKYGQNPVLMQIGMTALVFLLTLIVIYVLTGRFADRVLDSRVGMIDRLLGFGFGVLRGVLLVVIAFMFYTKFFPITKEQAASIPNARSLDFVQNTSDRLQIMLEPLVGSLMKKLNTRDGEEPAQGAPGQRGDAGRSLEAIDAVILAARGQLRPEFGGDPAQESSGGHKISGLRRIFFWIPDLRHA